MISPGEISKGMKITVLNWKPREVRDFFGSMFGGATTMTVTDNSYKGDILEVLEVSLPFITVKKLWSHYGALWGDEKPFGLDTRQVDLLELSQEYVDSVLKK